MCIICLPAAYVSTPSYRFADRCDCNENIEEWSKPDLQYYKLGCHQFSIRLVTYSQLPFYRVA